MQEIPEKIRRIIAIGGAMHSISEHYPKRYKGKIPLKVKMLETVTSDLPFFIMENNDPANICIKGNEYWVRVNCHGAVSAVFEDQSELGLKPSEFEVIEWHEFHH
jgi:hypothetical protein